jgi:hypothetical protein
VTKHNKMQMRSDGVTRRSLRSHTQSTKRGNCRGRVAVSKIQGRSGKKQRQPKRSKCSKKEKVTALLDMDNYGLQDTATHACSHLSKTMEGALTAVSEFAKLESVIKLAMVGSSELIGKPIPCNMLACVKEIFEEQNVLRTKMFNELTVICHEQKQRLCTLQLRISEETKISSELREKAVEDLKNERKRAQVISAQEREICKLTKQVHTLRNVYNPLTCKPVQNRDDDTLKVLTGPSNVAKQLMENYIQFWILNVNCDQCDIGSYTRHGPPNYLQSFNLQEWDTKSPFCSQSRIYLEGSFDVNPTRSQRILTLNTYVTGLNVSKSRALLSRQTHISAVHFWKYFMRIANQWVKDVSEH